jgi:hypothetical protein
MALDWVRKLDLVQIINEFVDVATRSRCRCLRLLGIHEVMMKVTYAISDADPGAEDKRRAFFKRDG